jgi:O-antigen ligase
MSIGAVAEKRIFRIQLALLYCLSAFPLWPLKVTTYLIIAFCISLSPTFTTERLKNRKQIIYLLIFILPFILFAASLLYDPGKQIIYFILEKKLSLIFLPIVIFFSSIKLRTREYHWLFTIFILSVVTEAAIVNTIILFTENIYRSDPSAFTFLYRQAFEKYSGIHPTYMCLFIFFALILNVHLMTISTFNKSKSLFIFRSALCVVLVISGIMMGARTPLLACIIAMSLYFLLRYRSKKKIIAGAFALLVVMALTIAVTPNFKERLKEFYSLQWRPPVFEEQNTANVRIGIYLCCNSLLKDNWIKGVGPGSLQTALDYCYGFYNTNAYEGKSYNTHNEFFNHWLSLGLPGILIFLAGLLIPGIYAWREKRIIYFSFLVFFYVCCLTENLLSRQMGVVFFAVFNSLLAFCPYPDSPEDADRDKLHAASL